MSAIEQTREEPTLNLIPQDAIERVLPLVDDHLKSVVERSRGRMDRAAILECFRTGSLQLWVVWNGGILAVGATELIVEASGMKICMIRFLTGQDSLGWLHTLDELEAWAKHQGCARIVGEMRKGWAKRLPEYRMTHVCLEKDLA